jgi:proline iminopeptidase
MHGGPGADHSTLLPLLPLSTSHTLIFYDHRCNGRSQGADVGTMTWNNLVEDAEAIRNHLGFETWAVVGHSFGGMVALEYAIRHSDRITQLVLLGAGADAWWVQKRLPETFAERGFSRRFVAMTERFYNGQISPGEFTWSVLRLSRAYFGNPSVAFMAKQALLSLRIHASASAFIQGSRFLLTGWSVMDRLGNVSCPTLIVAGANDLFFPPEHQREMEKRIRGARLEIVRGAGHNVHMERPDETRALIAAFVQG